MYAYIKGTLTAADPMKATIENNGIGYLIHIPASTFGKMPNPGEEVMLYTSYIVREQSQTLYGFTTDEERALFELLITVSGIGPKIGLSLIGHMPVESLYHAIDTADVKTICKIPGIGKKSAERLIVEVRDKLPHKNFKALNSAKFAIDLPKQSLINDAISALTNLGYQQNAAQKAIEKTFEQKGEEVDLSTLITVSLRNI